MNIIIKARAVIGETVVAEFEIYDATTAPQRRLTLKGQCHEMVVEVRLWSGSLALN
jgi:hypothetical protein